MAALENAGGGLKVRADTDAPDFAEGAGERGLENRERVRRAVGVD
jgi:hypothetical protein